MNKLDDERLVVVKGLLEEAVEIISNWSAQFSSDPEAYNYLSFCHKDTHIEICYNDDGFKNHMKTSTMKICCSKMSTVDSLYVTLDQYLDLNDDIGFYIHIVDYEDENNMIDIYKDFYKAFKNKVYPEELDIDALLNEINQ